MGVLMAAAAAFPATKKAIRVGSALGQEVAHLEALVAYEVHPHFQVRYPEFGV